MPRPVPIILTNRAWVRPKYVSDQLLDDYYYEKKVNALDEFGVWVEDVEGIDLITDSQDRSRLGFPRGDLAKLTRHFGHCGFDLIDKRSVAPLGFPLRLNDKVTEDPRWDEQSRLLDAWLAAGGGVIKAPAASGKSVIGVAATCALELRTLFLFDRKDFLKQWHEEFYKHTNLAEMEEIAGEPLAGRFTGKKVYPITFATFQKLNTRGAQAFLANYRDYFGLVVCDETHHVAAPTNRNAVMMFNPLVLGGVTATPKRKDKLEGIYYDVLGPIVAAGGAEQLNPVVHLVPTNFEVTPNKWKPDFAQWNIFLDQICKSKERNELIVTKIARNLKEGRRVLCVSDRVKHCFVLREMLSSWTDSIAVAVGSTPNRDKLYREVNAGAYDVLIAGKVIDEGVNITRLDTLHYGTPLASASRTEQRLGRIRRPDPHKLRPEAYDYLDFGHGMIDGAARARQRVYHSIEAVVRDARTGMIITPDMYDKKQQKRRRRRRR